MVYRGGVETVNELRKLLSFREQTDIESHVEEGMKRGKQIKIRDNEYKLSDLDTRKNELIEDLKNLEYNDLEDMVFRMGLTYSEIENILDMKYIPTLVSEYTLPLGIYEISDINSMLKSLLPDEVKVNIIIDDIRLRSNLTIIKIKRLIKKSFFKYFIGIYSI